MQKVFTLRTLTIFSFVIFFLPFIRTCSSYPKQQVEVEETANNDHNNHLQNHLYTNSERIFNFYSLSFIIGSGFIGFTIILILSILLVFYSFKNNFILIYWLSLANLLILFITTLILWLNETIESFNQIKIGYYLFLINTLAIIYFSKKLQIGNSLKRTSNFDSRTSQ